MQPLMLISGMNLDKFALEKHHLHTNFRHVAHINMRQQAKLQKAKSAIMAALVKAEAYDAKFDKSLV